MSLVSYSSIFRTSTVYQIACFLIRAFCWKKAQFSKKLVWRSSNSVSISFMFGTFTVYQTAWFLIAAFCWKSSILPLKRSPRQFDFQDYIHTARSSGIITVFTNKKLNCLFKLSVCQKARLSLKARRYEKLWSHHRFSKWKAQLQGVREKVKLLTQVVNRAFCRKKNNFSSLFRSQAFSVVQRLIIYGIFVEKIVMKSSTLSCFPVDLMICFVSSSRFDLQFWLSIDWEDQFGEILNLWVLECVGVVLVRGRRQQM